MSVRSLKNWAEEVRVEQQTGEGCCWVYRRKVRSSIPSGWTKLGSLICMFDESMIVPVAGPI